MALRDKMSLQELTLADVKCPICLSIYVEPVTMPCFHTLCMPCFVQNVAQTALACPMCRKRISVWVRRQSKAKKLVDKRLWDKIQEKFSPQLEARLRDEDDNLLDDEGSLPKPRVCQPGEIRQEYEALLAQQERERSLQRREEELASSKLIQQLQEEEKMKLRERREHQLLICAKDEAVAQQMKEAEGMSLQEEQMVLKQLCEQDEVFARQIEKEEKRKSQPVIVSPVQHKKPVKKNISTPTRGPMDLFLGNKSPQYSHKERIHYSHSRTTPSRFNSNSDKSSLSDISIEDMTSRPTTSTSSSDQRLPGSTMDWKSTKRDVPTFEGLATRVGRQLREITSSQSSESESEDVGVSSPSRYKKSDKENIGSPSRSGRVKLKFKKSINTAQFSPDIDSYCGVKSESSEELTHGRLENSDETDIEEDLLGSKGNMNNMDIISNVSVNCVKSAGTIEGPHIDGHPKASTSKSNHSSDTQLLEEVFKSEVQKSDDVSDLIKEQELLEARIKQEEQDRLLAEALQRELNRIQVDRSRGSEDEYALRDRKPSTKSSRRTSKSPVETKLSPKPSKKRQSTLMESMKKRQRT